MIRKFVDFALNNRILIVAFAILLFIWGGISFHQLPVEAYPDVANAKRKAAVQAFRTEWDKTHKDLTGAVGAQAGWDEVQLLATAIRASHATGGEALRAALETASISGTSTDYMYNSADHTGQQKVAIPFAVGQYQGSTLSIVSQFPE